MSWILLLALLEVTLTFFQPVETSPYQHDPPKIIKSGLATPWASLPRICGCILSRPFDLWMSSLFKWSPIWSYLPWVRRPCQRKTSFTLSHWSHIPGASFACKDWCEDDLQCNLVPSTSFVTRSLPHWSAAGLYFPCLLFAAAVSTEAHLLPFMSLTRFSSKWVLEVLNLSLHAQTVAL